MSATTLCRTTSAASTLLTAVKSALFTRIARSSSTATPTGCCEANSTAELPSYKSKQHVVTCTKQRPTYFDTAYRVALVHTTGRSQELRYLGVMRQYCQHQGCATVLRNNTSFRSRPGNTWLRQTSGRCATHLVLRSHVCTLLDEGLGHIHAAQGTRSRQGKQARLLRATQGNRHPPRSLR